MQPPKKIEVKLSKSYKSTVANETKLKNYIKSETKTDSEVK
jgi:hypothetical protein